MLRESDEASKLGTGRVSNGYGSEDLLESLEYIEQRYNLTVSVWNGGAYIGFLVCSIVYLIDAYLSPSISPN